MTAGSFLGPLSFLTVMAVLASAPWAVAQKTIEPPANAPATVEWNAGKERLKLRYHGGVILDAAIRAEDAAGRPVAGVEVKLEPSETAGEKVEQRLKFIPAKPREGVKLVLRGTVTGSEEAFPAETESAAQKRFPFVRNSVGLSRNLRNNAVYDRRWDWVLVGPADGATRIQPEREEKQRITFTWESRGASLELVFRPRFYQKHKDIAHFEPWTYKAWKGSMTGYCTWWAYKSSFSQTTLDQIVDVFAEKKLADFGYRYIQLDDAYQIGNGSCPRNWLTWNEKFPGGADYTIRKIRSAGLEPGIWVHRVHRPSDPGVADIGKQHPDWFVRKPNGELFMDQGFYCLNTRNKDALDGMARPIYRELKKQGWGYVKIDGAGDLLYSYRNQPEHFKKIGTTPGESLRAWDQVAREELGRDVYILTCWGVKPGLNSIGLVDGCRLGSDGFGPAGLQRFTSWNGVVWRNDPDHCDILAEWLTNKTMMKTFGAQAAMTDTIEQPCIVSMAGGVLMVSDKAEAYKDDSNLEGMKRSAPVLFTVPGQLYDYSQRGPGDYGAPLRGGEATWWMLEIDRPFDHWSVLARFNWRREKLGWKRPGSPETEVKFADLGLAEDREYLVFEFWTQTFLGESKSSFKAPAQDASNGLQVFAIREARPHPWILSTTRHISQDGVSLLDERWDNDRKILSGKSAVVSGDPYVLTVHLPRGFRLRSAEVGGEKVEFANQTETATVRIVPSATKTVEWRIAFAAGAGAIDLGSLLEDMLDRSQIAEFPRPEFVCKQAGSYNRLSKTPGNPDWFIGGDFCQFYGSNDVEGRKEWFMLDVEGPGVVTRWWLTQYRYEGTIRIYLDGAKEPIFEGRGDKLVGGNGITVPPLAAVRGAGCNLYLPIPFRQHCRITYDGPNAGTSFKETSIFYNINYLQYPKGTEVKTLTKADLKASSELLARVGRELLRPEDNHIAIHRKVKGGVQTLKPGQTMTRKATGQGAICLLRLRIGAKDIEQAMRSTVITADFDGKRRVWAPFGEFFGSGLGINPYKDWWRRVEKDGWMTCWWPMPFRKSAELNITNQGMSESIEAEFDDIGIAAWKWTDRTMYFHSAWRGENLIETVGDDLKNMKEWNYITIEGKGVYVGDSLSLYNRPRMNWHLGPWWGEGDEKIFVDGESFPSHFGTGSEDYYGYAFNSTSPFEAPFHAQPIAKANWGIGHTTDERVRIHDRIPFKTKFRFDMELFHWQPKRKIDYATTTHWYACDGATSNGQATPEKVREKVAQPWAGPDETPATNSR